MKYINNWRELPFFNSDDLQEVADYLSEKENQGKVIVPPYRDIFKALLLSGPNNTKVVIIGQDPYPQMNYANGLAFSVDKGIPIPGSLRNIYEELYTTHYKYTPFPTHGDLTKWAKQGVLLLNSSLTTELNVTNAHTTLWVNLIKQVLGYLNQRGDIVFILWGKNAQTWKYVLTNKHNMIIESPHPSPLSAHTGFFGSDPFGRANMFLLARNIETIDWKIDP